MFVTHPKPRTVSPVWTALQGEAGQPSASLPHRSPSGVVCTPLDAFRRIVFPSPVDCLDTSMLGSPNEWLPVPHSPANVYRTYTKSSPTAVSTQRTQNRRPLIIGRSLSVTRHRNRHRRLLLRRKKFLLLMPPHASHRLHAPRLRPGTQTGGFRARAVVPVRRYLRRSRCSSSRSSCC